jgi:myo-inositol catabolism protein IolS
MHYRAGPGKIRVVPRVPTSGARVFTPGGRETRTVNYRTLGGTSIEVSEIAMGLWGVSGGNTWGEQDEQDAIDAIHAAIDEGVTFFDTAEGYGGGYSEELLGATLETRDREDLVIATKVSAGNLRPEDLKSACERSLERLNTDYVDVYYVHWPNRDVPLAETMSAMQDLRDEGAIRAIGVSNFGPEDLETALEHAPVAVNQLPYSLLWRTIENGLVGRCLENDVRVTSYSSLCLGLLTGKFRTPEDVPDGRARTRHFSPDRPGTRHDGPDLEAETFVAIDAIRDVAAENGVDMTELAIAWLLSRPGLTSAVVGARNPQQARANARATDVEISGETVAALDRATADLKKALGSNHDMYQTDSRYR